MRWPTDQVKEEIHACGMLPILVGLVDSPVADIARAAVVCIGQSLPSGELPSFADFPGSLVCGCWVC